LAPFSFIRFRIKHLKPKHHKEKGKEKQKPIFEKQNFSTGKGGVKVNTNHKVISKKKKKTLKKNKLFI